MNRCLSVRSFIPPPGPRRTPIHPRRWYAIQTPGAPIAEVFDGRTKWMQKERAAKDAETSRKVDYLRDEVAVRLCERLLVRVILFSGRLMGRKALTSSRTFNGTSPTSSTWAQTHVTSRALWHGLILNPTPLNLSMPLSRIASETCCAPRAHQVSCTVTRMSRSIRR